MMLMCLILTEVLLLYTFHSLKRVCEAAIGYMPHIMCTLLIHYAHFKKFLTPVCLFSLQLLWTR